VVSERGQGLVEIGVVARPHGVRGDVKVSLHNPGSGALGSLSEVLVSTEGSAPRPVRVERARTSGRAAVVSLEGVDDRSAAEQMRGARVLVPRAALPPLEPGEFYVADLLGLEVLCGGGRVGEVRSSREQGGVEMVSVVDGECEVEIPVAQEYVVGIDFESGSMEVRDIGDLPRSPVARRTGRA